MIGGAFGRGAFAVPAVRPFFAFWFLVALSFARAGLSAVLIGSLISMGSAGLLGIPVWQASRRWPWPLGFKLKFYLVQIVLAVVYGGASTAAVYALESPRSRNGARGFW